MSVVVMNEIPVNGLLGDSVTVRKRQLQQVSKKYSGRGENVRN